MLATEGSIDLLAGECKPFVKGRDVEERMRRIKLAGKDIG
jgi:hypothetical protein